MVKFCSLSSGSSGNCIFIGTEETRILVDAGLSGCKIQKSMESIGESCEGTDAILITHEHEDHIHGAGILSRKYDIPIYATRGTWQAMCIGTIKEENKRITEEHFTIGDIEVTAFRTPHDAAESVAYSFNALGHKISIATDIGHMTDSIIENILGSELLLLESNHDEKMLRYSGYPKKLRDRIHGEYGHLSNEECARTAVIMAKSGTKVLFLGHLSHENNTPTLAYNTTYSQLLKNGFENGKNISLYVAKRDTATRLIEIN